MKSSDESAMARHRPIGMKAFLLVWIGQVTSMLGTSMTSFAIVFWAYDVTGSATALALVGASAFAPTVLFSPFAGALVDRWNRKLTMAFADVGAGVATGALLLLFAAGRLEVWHLYPIAAVAGTFSAFHFPAYSAAVTMMLPKKHYARASGMLSLAGSLSGILAPILAGILLATVGLTLIFAIDLVTVLAAVGAVLFVHIPRPPVTEEGRAGRGSLWREAVYGFRYILGRPSLLRLQLVFFAVNLIAGFSFILLPAMVLARTGNDAVRLGTVLAAAAVGQVVGGVLLSAWGGPKRKIHGVLMGMVATGLLGSVLLGVGRDFTVWATASFLGGVFVIIVNGSNQAIWQSKVAPDVQGRVFATRRLIAQVSAPVAMLLAGPLADYVFEPGMTSGGALASVFGGVVGSGPGTGIALMFIITGVLEAAVGLGAYAVRGVRDVETLLPDHAAADSQGSD